MPDGRLGRFRANPGRFHSAKIASPPQPWAVSPLGRRDFGVLQKPVYAPSKSSAIRSWPPLSFSSQADSVIQFANIMRIFILGAGATGSLLAQLLERQGHNVWCGDRDPARARRFLGQRSIIPVTAVNARNLRGIVRSAQRKATRAATLASARALDVDP